MEGESRRSSIRPLETRLCTCPDPTRRSSSLLQPEDSCTRTCSQVLDKDANAVEDEPFDPSVVTTVVSGHLNPCAASTCTAEETTAGKDNYEDMIVGTTSDTQLWCTSAPRLAPSLPRSRTTPPSSPFSSPPTSSSNTIEDTGSVESIVIQDVDADGLPDVVLFHENGPAEFLFADDQTADVFGNALRVPADFTRSLNTGSGSRRRRTPPSPFSTTTGRPTRGLTSTSGPRWERRTGSSWTWKRRTRPASPSPTSFRSTWKGRTFLHEADASGSDDWKPDLFIPLDLILGTDAGVKGIQAFFAQVPADKTVEDVTPLLSDLVDFVRHDGRVSEDVKALKVGKVDSDDISDVVFSTETTLPCCSERTAPSSRTPPPSPRGSPPT